MNDWYWTLQYKPEETITHHGIKGMEWGKRRWQNQDGSYNPDGVKRYGLRGFGRVTDFNGKPVRNIRSPEEAKRGKELQNNEEDSQNLNNSFDPQGDTTVSTSIKDSRSPRDLTITYIKYYRKSCCDLGSSFLLSIKEKEND